MSGFETDTVVKRFRKAIALDGVTLAAGPGRVHALLGPNGAGKTTLIRVLATLTRCDSGTARVAGYDVATAPGQVRSRIALGLDPARREHVWRLVASLRDEGVRILLTTQHLGEADVLADEVSVLDHGRVVASGTPASLKRQVGKHMLTIRVRAAADVAAAADTVHQVTGHRPTSAATRDLHAPATGAETLYAVTDRLRERAIDIDELALRLPTLDEVFLALTGNQTAAAPSLADPRRLT